LAVGLAVAKDAEDPREVEVEVAEIVGSVVQGRRSLAAGRALAVVAQMGHEAAAPARRAERNATVLVGKVLAMSRAVNAPVASPAVRPPRVANEDSQGSLEATPGRRVQARVIRVASGGFATTCVTSPTATTTCADRGPTVKRGSRPKIALIASGPSNFARPMRESVTTTNASQTNDSPKSGAATQIETVTLKLNGRTVSESSVRIVSESSVRIVSESSVRIVSESSVRTVSESSVRTVSGGSVRTVSGGSVRTVSGGSVRTVSESSVRTVNENEKLANVANVANVEPIAATNVARDKLLSRMPQQVPKAKSLTSQANSQRAAYCLRHQPAPARHSTSPRL